MPCWGSHLLADTRRWCWGDPQQDEGAALPHPASCPASPFPPHAHRVPPGSCAVPGALTLPGVLSWGSCRGLGRGQSHVLLENMRMSSESRGAVLGIGVTHCFARLGREADAGWSCQSVQEASRLLCVEDRERAGETTNKWV